MAEEVGFEPTNELPRCQFSRLVPSTTRPLFPRLGLLLCAYGQMLSPARLLHFESFSGKDR